MRSIYWAAIALAVVMILLFGRMAAMQAQIDNMRGRPGCSSVTR